MKTDRLDFTDQRFASFSILYNSIQMKLMLILTNILITLSYVFNQQIYNIPDQIISSTVKPGLSEPFENCKKFNESRMFTTFM